MKKKRGRNFEFNRDVLIAGGVFLLFILAVGIINDSTQKPTGYALLDGSRVYRTFSSTEVGINTVVTVTLNVVINGAHTFYAIEEDIPSGWTVVNDGGGSTGQTNSLKWVVIESATTSTYTYTVRAPAQPGSATFSGDYFIEHMDDISPTEGSMDITVTGACIPSTEICDGADNDCDGQTDEYLTAPPCELNQGVCAGNKFKSCGGSSGWLDCGTTEYGSNYETTEVTCDGLDNDCDSDVDENLITPYCDLQQGICSGSLKVCEGTSGWSICDASEYGSNYEATETQCDTLDNDCDSSIDEGCTCTTGQNVSCGTNIVICNQGIQSCVNGVWGTCGGSGFVGAQIEQCDDDLDNDCDGQTDEGCVTSGDGDGDGSDNLTQIKVTRLIKDAFAGSYGELNFIKDATVNSMIILFKGDVKNGSITVERFATKPDNLVEPDGKTYCYLDITKDVPDESIEKIKLFFLVPKDWFVKNSVTTDEIKLKKFTQEWETLDTENVGQTQDAYTYETELTSLSYFAVSTSATEEQPIVDDTNTTQPGSGRTIEDIMRADVMAAAKTKGLILLIIVLIIIGIIVTLFVVKKRKFIKIEKALEERDRRLALKNKGITHKKTKTFAKNKSDEIEIERIEQINIMEKKEEHPSFVKMKEKSLFKKKKPRPRARIKPEEALESPRDVANKFIKRTPKALVAHISECKKFGMDDVEIKSLLIIEGWKNDEIKRAFEILDERELRKK